MSQITMSTKRGRGRDGPHPALERPRGSEFTTMIGRLNLPPKAAGPDLLPLTPTDRSADRKDNGVIV